MNSFLLGNVVVLTGTFTDANGNLISPSTVSVEIEDPTGATNSFSATAASTGVYTYPYTPAIIGTYSYVFSSTGTVAVAQGAFSVVNNSIDDQGGSVCECP